VISGEADAGLVYVTDVEGAGDKVTGIDLPEARDVVNRYPIATVKDSEEPRLAQEFVDLVTGPDGRKVLADAGFGKP
jgi:molybdate transport system substrate-binding protein